MAHVDFQWNVRSGVPHPDGLHIAPGSALEGSINVTPDADLNCNNVFLRLRWQTEGRGTRDGQTAMESSVFQGLLPGGQPATFAFRLPAPDQPWSYRGRYVNILWELEAEIDLPRALNPKSALAFQLRTSET
jgi:hypothetical protein